MAAGSVEAKDVSTLWVCMWCEKEFETQTAHCRGCWESFCPSCMGAHQCPGKPYRKYRGKVFIKSRSTTGKWFTSQSFLCDPFPSPDEGEEPTGTYRDAPCVIDNFKPRLSWASVHEIYGRICTDRRERGPGHGYAQRLVLAVGEGLREHAEGISDAQSKHGIPIDVVISPVLNDIEWVLGTDADGDGIFHCKGAPEPIRVPSAWEIERERQAQHQKELDSLPDRVRALEAAIEALSNR